MESLSDRRFIHREDHAWFECASGFIINSQYGENSKINILMVNLVVETNSYATTEWKGHVQVHSQSVNAGQSGIID